MTAGWANNIVARRYRFRPGSRGHIVLRARLRERTAQHVWGCTRLLTYNHIASPNAWTDRKSSLLMGSPKNEGSFVHDQQIYLVEVSDA